MRNTGLALVADGVTGKAEKSTIVISGPRAVFDCLRGVLASLSSYW